MLHQLFQLYIDNRTNVQNLDIRGKKILNTTTTKSNFNNCFFSLLELKRKMKYNF